MAIQSKSIPDPVTTMNEMVRARQVPHIPVVSYANPLG